MNGWVCVPNMGASISGLGLKLPPDLLPFLTTAQGSRLPHSPNWKPLQAIGGHDSPALNTEAGSGGSAECSSGAGIPMRSSAQHWPMQPIYLKHRSKPGSGQFLEPIQLLGANFEAMQTPNHTNKREKL